MITVKADIIGHTMEITGHAGGEYGKDIVCAAVSALAMTLAQMCLDLSKRYPEVYPIPEIVMESGDFRIRAECRNPSRDLYYGMTGSVRLDVVFETVYCGLSNLAKTYPKKIRCMG